MEFILALLVLVLVTRLAGEAFHRVRQSPMIGEVLAGILIGPSVLAFIDPDPATALGAALAVIASLGVYFLVLAAAMEMGSEGLKSALKEGTYVVAATEFIFPFALGYALGQGLGLDLVGSLFMGTALAVTALPVSIRIFMDLKLLQTKLGRTVVAVAMVNDILAFGFLGVILALQGATGASPTDQILLSSGKILLFLAVILGVSRVLRIPSKRHGGRPYLAVALEKLKTSEAPFAMAVLITLGLGALAELAGLHFVIGVFYGGLLLTPLSLGGGHFMRVLLTTRGVGFGFLAPVFFAVVGLKVSFGVTNWPLVILVCAAAFFGKIVGGLIGGALAGFRGRTLAALGVGLNARGMMELLLAEVGLATGMINLELYSAIVIMTLVTTLSTPILLRVILNIWKDEGTAASPGAPGTDLDREPQPRG